MKKGRQLMPLPDPHRLDDIIYSSMFSYHIAKWLTSTPILIGGI